MKLIVLLFLSLTINSFCKIVMNKKEWVNKLVTLANEPSDYSQKYGWNALRWDGSKWWCDCSNLMKALFNGRDITDKTKDKFEQYTGNTGDVNADGLINKCSDLSSDFSKLKKHEPRLIHMKGHIGAFIGKEVVTDHGICNVVECTAAWNRGIQFSYVDSKGNRLYGKNGTKKAAWTKHGKPSSWVSY